MNGGSGPASIDPSADTCVSGDPAVDTDRTRCERAVNPPATTGTTAPARSRWLIAADAAELPPGSVIGRQIDGHEIALCRLDDGSLHAVSNLCSHEQARLSDGWLIDSTLCCPFHGGQFDVRSGIGLCAPAERPIQCYRARVTDSRIEIELPAQA